MEDFQKCRELYKGRLSPAELRDIPVAQDERGGPNFTGKDIDAPRPAYSEATRVKIARGWAVTTQRQAVRAAREAKLGGAPQTAKNAADVLATAAALAMEDFQKLRELYKDRLSPAELRDIDVTPDERGSSNFTGKDVDGERIARAR
jgi:hypothetical protein